MADTQRLSDYLARFMAPVRQRFKKPAPKPKPA